MMDYLLAAHETPRRERTQSDISIKFDAPGRQVGDEEAQLLEPCPEGLKTSYMVPAAFSLWMPCLTPI